MSMQNLKTVGPDRTHAPTHLMAGEFDVGGVTPEGLSPEGLMIYLQTRLNSLDDQINVIFDKQKKVEAIREQLLKIQTELDRLPSDPNNPQALLEDTEFEANIQNSIEAIRKLDPTLAKAIETDLGKQGHILYCPDTLYFTSEIDASGEYINGVMKQLESSAQLEMIRLQSLMSSRQTAVQLSTNLVSALNEGPRAIAANIGK